MFHTGCEQSYIAWVINSFLPKTMAASLTLRVIMPGTSMELTNGMRPCLDSRPYVGFKATTPHRAPGLRVEPPVSEPRALPNVTNTVHFDLIQIFLFFGTVFFSQ